MDHDREVTLWPTPENYQRFRAVCDDQIPETFEEFEAVASRQLAALAAQGIEITKLSFDPDHMALWCRSNFGKVNAASRASYAGFLALSD